MISLKIILKVVFFFHLSKDTSSWQRQMYNLNFSFSITVINLWWVVLAQLRFLNRNYRVPKGTRRKNELLRDLEKIIKSRECTSGSVTTVIDCTHTNGKDLEFWIQRIWQSAWFAHKWNNLVTLYNKCAQISIY